MPYTASVPDIAYRVHKQIVPYTVSVPGTAYRARRKIPEFGYSGGMLPRKRAVSRPLCTAPGAAGRAVPATVRLSRQDSLSTGSGPSAIHQDLGEVWPVSHAACGYPGHIRGKLAGGFGCALLPLVPRLPQHAREGGR
eukprot:3297046-Rhodomonas_salina.1